MTILLFIALLAYFTPAMIAFNRKHHNAGAIFALNLLLGWTFLGWVIAFVWSLTAVQPGVARASRAAVIVPIIVIGLPLLFFVARYNNVF